MEKVSPWCGQPLDRGRLKDQIRSHRNRSLGRTAGALAAINVPRLPIVAAVGEQRRNARPREQPRRQRNATHSLQTIQRTRRSDKR